MQTWNSDIFQSNHLRLMKCHIGLLVLWLIVTFFGIAAQVFDPGSDSDGSDVAMVVFCALMAVLHAALSYGSYKKIEVSRKASEFIFALTLLAFPIGTFLAMYLLLPATQWKEPENS